MLALGWLVGRGLRLGCRFSLLLLDPGETYFEDFSVDFFPPGCNDRQLSDR
jgi:hypothetical protein